MSNRQMLLGQARTACQNCFTRHLFFLTDAHRLSSEVKGSNTILNLELGRLHLLKPFPDCPPELVSEISGLSAIIEMAATDDDLQTLQAKLLVKFQSIGTPRNARPPSTNPLNTRMIDLLNVMKDHIRATRRRLNDAGGGYDLEAYQAARNQAYFCQNLYLEQLDNDYVFATGEDCVTLKDIHYPDISNAIADSFVNSIEVMVDFFKARILNAFATLVD